MILLILLSSLVTAAAEPSCQVRVLLAEAAHTDAPEWKLSCPAGFTVTAGAQGEYEAFKTSETDLCVGAKKKRLYLGEKFLGPDRVTIVAHGICSWNGYQYAGTFNIVRDANKVYLVNEIDLEEYVYSVLRWESWPGWPLEVNRAFAITCRSYVVSKLYESRSSKKNSAPYDIKATNIHQTYKGSHDIQSVWQAIEETRGIVLAHEGKPIIAMYDCCCGGVIPARMHGVDFKAAPYLARDYACTFCKDSKLYTWSLEYDIAHFERLLEKSCEKKITISDIKVNKKDKAGIVREVEVSSKNARTSLSGKKVYSLCKDIKSYFFSIEKKAKKILIQGKGYGHHLGLCQWGSREMVRQGWDYKSILRFFYPGTVFMKVEGW